MKRNNGLDELRLYAAILVCLQHTLDGIGISGYILVLSRIAVPIFFLISGFYFSAERDKVFKQIKKLMIIAIEMTLLYFAADFIMNLSDLGGYFCRTFTINNVLNLLMFNDPFIADHAWYIFAAMYSSAILYCLAKTKHVYSLDIIIVFLLSVLLIFGKYSIIILNKHIPSYVTRSWLCVGVPFMAIGYRYREWFLKSKTKVNLACCMLFSLLTILEWMGLKASGQGASREFYLGTILTAVFVFAFFLKKKNSKVSTKVAAWGREYSLTVYVIHPLFIRIYNIISARIDFLNCCVYSNLLKTTFTIICSMVFSVAYIHFKECMKGKIQ